MAGNVRVQGQDEQGAVLIGAVEFFFIELIEKLGVWHGAASAEVGSFSERPVDGELDYAGGFAVGDDFVRLVHSLQAAVVEESSFSDQVESVLAEGPAGGAVADGTLAGGLRQVVDGLRQQAIFFSGVVDRGRGFVNPA